MGGCPEKEGQRRERAGYKAARSDVQGMRREKLKLGEPDCGEDPPGWVEKSPCHPPKGPCTPMGPPGYPAKPRQEKKPFCVKCPPKKPCKTRKC